MLRLWFTRLAYRLIFKPWFFHHDPESVHERVLHIGKLFGGSRAMRGAVKWWFGFSHPALGQTLAGLNFSNPVGLAAGFDKEAELVSLWPAVGFGFAEVGSVTAEPCAGNPKPRLWRLPKSRSLVVYYGLKNAGSAAIAEHLRAPGPLSFPIGISIAKTNSPATVELAQGIADYVKGYCALADLGSYTTINISCPNAYGGEPFTDPERLSHLLDALQSWRMPQPIFLKLSPDISHDVLDAIIILARRHHLAGFICSNLTKRRAGVPILDDNVPSRGGLSGKVSESLANDQIKYIHRKIRGEFIIIGCGGVFSAEDAYHKIRAGASLVQLVTGMIFEGPQLISEINRGLVGLLKKDGFVNVGQAVGADSRS